MEGFGVVVVQYVKIIPISFALVVFASKHFFILRLIFYIAQIKFSFRCDTNTRYYDSTVDACCKKMLFIF